MLQNVRIGGKLAIGFGILIAVILTISIIALLSFSYIRSTEEQLISVNLTKLNLSNRVGYLIRTQAIELFRIESGIASHGARQIITDTVAECHRTVAQYLELLDRNDFDEMAIWNELVQHRNVYLNTIGILTDHLDIGNRREFNRVFFEVYDRALDAYLNVITELVNYQSQNMVVKTAYLNDLIIKDQTIMMTVAILGLIIAIVFAMIISRLITTPVARCIDIAHNLERGNTKIKIEVKSKDEMGELTLAMKNMALSITKMYDDCMHLSSEAADGKLRTRIDVNRHQNDYANIIKGINSILDAMGPPFAETGQVINKLANKDMTARIVGNHPNDYNGLKQDINKMAAAIEDSFIQVNSAVEMISSASNQISSGSQELAESTSEQASSLEEISSSLEEINSLTGNNADNAKSGLRLADHAVLAVDAGNEAMEKMNVAMDAILQSSKETGKILKTIDEIAFQTNLLALNAAVEAAHAGDAGKGFAVVAEEVKNLALRSAEAAKNTNVLIDEATQNSQMGSSIVEQVTKSFLEMKEQFSKVKSIVNEIAASSEEQAQGVNQISTGVNEMNRVTQQNAANAEESASAAQELHSQAAELHRLVEQYNISREETCV